MFYPIAIETAGTWDDMAIELVQEIGRRTTVITQDTRETVFPVHSSAAGECGLLPQHSEHRIRSYCSSCLTLCLLFTPAAYFWWAKKLISCFLAFGIGDALGNKKNNKQNIRRPLHRQGTEDAVKKTGKPKSTFTGCHCRCTAPTRHQAVSDIVLRTGV